MKIFFVAATRSEFDRLFEIESRDNCTRIAKQTVHDCSESDSGVRIMVKRFVLSPANWTTLHDRDCTPDSVVSGGRSPRSMK